MQQLPALNMLPQWNRFSTLDKVRYPKPFTSDKNVHIQSMIQQNELDKLDNIDQDMNPVQKAGYLERNIQFLKQQHQSTLKCLHDEIDALKKENKDLQFTILMSEKQKKPDRNKESSPNDYEIDDEYSQEQTNEVKIRSEEVKVIFLNEEIKELKRAFRETTNTNTYLKQLVEQLENQTKQQNATIEKLQSTQQLNSQGDQDVKSLSDKLFDGDSKEPTLAECHHIIKHLKTVNEQQSHELESLKSDLRDVLYSHKWTPDAYLLAKSYVASDDSSDRHSLPKIAVKQSSRKRPDLDLFHKDSVSLPALKSNVSNKATDRQKRAQLMQKARFREALLK